MYIRKKEHFLRISIRLMRKWKANKNNTLHGICNIKVNKNAHARIIRVTKVNFRNTWKHDIHSLADLVDAFSYISLFCPFFPPVFAVSLCVYLWMCVYSFQPFKFYSVLRFNQFKDIFAALEKYSCWMSCIRPFIFSRFFCSALKTYTVFPFHIASRSGIYILNHQFSFIHI